MEANEPKHGQTGKHGGKRGGKKSHGSDGGRGGGHKRGRGRGGRGGGGRGGRGGHGEDHGTGARGRSGHGGGTADAGSPGRGGGSRRGGRRGGRGGQNHGSPAGRGRAPHSGSPGKSPHSKHGGKRTHAAVYADHLHWRDVQEGLERGHLLFAELRVNRHRSSEAYGVVKDLPFDVLVLDEHQNRALPGDVVALEVLPEASWEHELRRVEEEGADRVPSTALDALASRMQGMELDGDAAAGASEIEALWRPRVNMGGWEAGQGVAGAAAPPAAPRLDESGRHVPSADAAEVMGRGAAASGGGGGAMGGVEGRALSSLSAPLTEAYAGAVETLSERAQRLQRRPRAKVVAVIERRHSGRVIGTLRPPRDAVPGRPLHDKNKWLFLVPMDTRLPYARVYRDDLPQAVLADPAGYRETLVAGMLDADWPTTFKNPRARVTGQLGASGTVEAETQALLQQFGVDHGEFRPEVLASLDAFRENVVPVSADGTPLEGEAAAAAAGGDDAATAYRIPEDERARRRDLTGLRIFTIDPSTAKDLDDAVHVRCVAPGVYELGVHIADVTYFVRPNTALDEEAQRRATTVYLVQKALPMLPRLLSDNLCSLNPNVERLTYSCIWRMNAKGEMLGAEPWYGRTIIRSCCKLDYGTAQRVIDGEITTEDAEAGSVDPALWETARRPTGGHTMLEIAKDVKLMNRIAVARRRRRFESGALAINLPKLAFELEPESQAPLAFKKYITKEANHLVEELMLLANYLVAEFLLRVGVSRAFLRCHPPPLEKINAVAELAREYGIPLHVNSSYHLRKSLEELQKISADAAEGRYRSDVRVAKEAQPYLAAAITALVAGPLKPAEYFAMGEQEMEKARHYGLAIPFYTHFTSPIRRYADVMVHRLLTASLETLAEGGTTLEEYYLDSDELDMIAAHCNDKKRNADAAQDRSGAVFLCMYLKEHPMLDEPAVVTDAGGDKFIKVEVPRLGMELQVFFDRSGLVAKYSKEESKVDLWRMHGGPSRAIDGSHLPTPASSDEEDEEDEDEAAAAAAVAAAVDDDEEEEEEEESSAAVAPAEQVSDSPHSEAPRGASGDPIMTLRVFDAVRLNIRSTSKVPIQVVGLLKH